MYSQEIMDFIRSPDTIDFIARGTDAFFDHVQTNTGILVTQVLFGRYVLGYAKKENYRELVELLGPSFVYSSSMILGPLDRPSLEAAGIIQVHNQPYLDLRGRNVLIGFVDTGIDFTNEVFRYEDNTSKIQFIYDQTADGQPPEGFFFGREYANAEINAALQSENPLSQIPHRDENGHGTFLASIAAGREVSNFVGAAPDAEIIMVKLKPAKSFYRQRQCVPETQKEAFSASAVVVGIEYILRKARALNRPVAICIGLGTNFGSHDGFSLLEEYLSQVSNLRGTCVCVAAGNENQERHHTDGILSAQGESENIDLRVGERAGNICISLWNTVSDRMSVSIRSPSGELVGRIPPKNGRSVVNKLILEDAEVEVTYYFPVEGSGGQLTVIRIGNATPGIWTITVYGDIVLDGSYHAFLPMRGFVAEDVEFLSATPYYTTTIPSTAVGIICCGAYDSVTQSLYIPSSWGPSRSGRILPDFVAPGDQVGGFFPLGLGTMSGTSVACAITAGACALLLQWGLIEKNDLALSTYQIRAYLIRGCQRNAALAYPNEQWGYGTLDLLQTFYLMREL